MDSNSVGSLTLSHIIQRQINFLLDNQIFPKAGNEESDRGELEALQNMLSDSKRMSEKDFVTKYLNELVSLRKRFESKIYAVDDGDDYYESYNNALVYILKMINPINEFDLSD